MSPSARSAAHPRPTTRRRYGLALLGCAALAACGGGGGGTPTPPASTTTLTLATQPAGLALSLNGQAAPTTFEASVGSEHTLAAETQVANGRRWTFASWSDGGGATHTIIAPSTPTTYTATFADAGPATGTAPSIVILTAASSARVGVATTLSVTAADVDNDLVKVEFLDAGVVLGEDTTAPYTFNWTPGAAGAHVITARAVDAQGLSASSSAVTVAVSP